MKLNGTRNPYYIEAIDICIGMKLVAIHIMLCVNCENKLVVLTTVVTMVADKLKRQWL